MMLSKRIWITGFLLLGTPFFSFAQSIEEKKAHLQGGESDFDRETDQFLTRVNRETQAIHLRIQKLYEEVYRLYQQEASPDQYQGLLSQINEEKKRLIELEKAWRDVASRSSRPEGYGLWHAPETTLEQLIIDYGSQDYVYLIPPEVGGIRLSIDSNLPIPRAAWSEMLELILNQNGVGIKTLNPYLRQLYLIRQNHSNLRMITNKKADLEVLPLDARVSFVISPEPSEIRRTYSFLERFIDPNTTVLQILGRDVLIIGQVGDILDLLKLYDFIATNRGDKDYRLLPMSKVPPEEMARILATIFDQGEAGPRLMEMEPPRSMPPVGGGPSGGPGGPPMPSPGAGANLARAAAEINGLRIVPLQNMAQSLFVVGTREEVRKAEEIVRNVESQIGGARDKIVFWYTVKHSDPEELADILYRVYLLMVTTGAGFDRVPAPGGPFGPGGPGGPGGPMGPGGPGGPGGPLMPGAPPDLQQTRVVINQNSPAPPPILPPQKEPPLLLYGQEGFYQEGGYMVNPAPAQPGVFLPTNPNRNRENFIVDAKTGAIVMVVEAELLPKIKDLLRKLDVPKKMVHIESLLFEKIINRENSFGLNLLRLGDAACNVHKTGAAFNNIFPCCSDVPILGNAGVFEFFISRKKTDSGIPAFDLVYRFLLNQDDVQINSNPSILTVNQAPATISINEDLSINTGIFEVETAKGVTLKDAYTRAQYGITISIKPTIHLNQYDDCDQDYDYVTLETDITFDTIQPGGDPSRPNVVRRHITNQVQIPDGDTVILGGLRRKISNDSRESIPFIGELPGLGKLFSINTLRDSSTEMFIFLTPHIVKDPKEQLTCLRQELLCLRPGDIPYFLECVEEAFQYEKNRLMEGSMTILFGRPRERYYILDSCSANGVGDCAEYDGR